MIYNWSSLSKTVGKVSTSRRQSRAHHIGTTEDKLDSTSVNLHLDDHIRIYYAHVKLEHKPDGLHLWRSFNVGMYGPS